MGGSGRGRRRTTKPNLMVWVSSQRRLEAATCRSTGRGEEKGFVIPGSAPGEGVCVPGHQACPLFAPKSGQHLSLPRIDHKAPSRVLRCSSGISILTPSGSPCPLPPHSQHPGHCSPKPSRAPHGIPGLCHLDKDSSNNTSCQVLTLCQVLMLGVTWAWASGSWSPVSGGGPWFQQWGLQRQRVSDMGPPLRFCVVRRPGNPGPTSLPLGTSKSTGVDRAPIAPDLLPRHSARTPGFLLPSCSPHPTSTGQKTFWDTLQEVPGTHPLVTSPWSPARPHLSPGSSPAPCPFLSDTVGRSVAT